MNSKKRNLVSKSTEQIKKEILEFRHGGGNYLEFIGGEPTARVDLEELIMFAKKAGFKRIAMATNGRMFSYFDYAKRIISAGLSDVIFSIHGHNSQLHDYLTSVQGSFNQLLAGINNFKKLNFSGKMGTDTVIIKQTYKWLPKIGQFIYDLGFRNSEFIFVDPNQGAPFYNFHKFVPRISKAAPYIKKCLDIGKKHCIMKEGERFTWKNNWAVRYVPLCLFLDYYPTQISEAREVQIYQKIEHSGPDFHDADAIRGRQEISRVKPLKCQGCKLYNQCEGIWKEYIKHYGDKELRPIS